MKKYIYLPILLLLLVLGACSSDKVSHPIELIGDWQFDEVDVTELMVNRDSAKVVIFKDVQKEGSRYQNLNFGVDGDVKAYDSLLDEELTGTYYIKKNQLHLFFSNKVDLHMPITISEATNKITLHVDPTGYYKDKKTIEKLGIASDALQIELVRYEIVYRR